MLENRLTRKLFDIDLCLEITPAGRSFIPHSRIHNNRLNKTGLQDKSQKILFDSTSATGIRLTCLLLIISFIFVLCTLPISIRSLMTDSRFDHKSTARWQIIHLSLTTLMYLNHAVKDFFFLDLENGLAL